jgi:tetratricopeptide (TPR) repeat protein
MSAPHGHDLGNRLRAAGEHVDHALLAMRMSRPDRQRDAAKRALEAAKSVLDRASLDVARREATAEIPRADGEIDMERRVLLKALMGASLVPMGALEALERTRSMSAGRDRIDDGLLWALRSLVAAYGQAFETMQPATLAPSVTALVDRITERLSDPSTPAYRQQLAPIASEAAALAGWLAHTLDHQGAAVAYFSLARDAAREAGDNMLHALALGSMAQLHSSTPSGGHAGSPAALRLLEEANDRIPAYAPPVSRTFLAARLAEEQAAMGDAESYRRSMDRAEDIWSEGTPLDDRWGFFSSQGFFASWEDHRFNGYRGICLVLLKEPGEAETYLRQSLLHNLGEWRPRAVALADLTAAYALQGEPEQACEAARGALSTATRTGFPMGVKRLRGARTYLDRWQRHPEVMDLDERLAAA